MKLEGFIRYIVSCLLILSSIVAFGQQSIVKGRVHIESGESVSHATITVKGTSISSMSDKNGYYSLPNVPYGNQEIQVTAIEIQPKTVRLKIDKPTHDFSISVSSTGDIAIEGVEVSRMTEKKDMETSGFAVAVIETKEASLRNLTTNELLDRAVGVRVRQNGGEGSPIEYNLNGMSGSTIGLFLDGIEISTYGSSFNLNNIPPAMIERIEVYKGVLPSHLSGNYIGGAINVVMKKDASANNITASVSYGSFNTYRADIGGLYRNQKNGLTFRASGFYSHSDNDYEMWGKFSKYTLPNGRVSRYYRTKRPNDEFRTIGGRFELGFTDVRWADQFFVGYNVSDSYKEIPHGITMTKPYFGRFNDYQAHVFSLNYHKNNLLLNGLSLQVNAVHSMRNTYLQDTVSRKYNWDGTPLMAPPNSSGEVKPYPYEPGMGQQGEAVMTDIDRKITNIRSNLAYMVYPGHRLSVNHKFESTSRDDQDLLHVERSRWITNSDLTTNIFSANYETELLDGKLRTNLFGKYMRYHSIQHIPVEDVNGTMRYDRRKSTNDNKGFGGTLSYQAIKDGFVIISAEKAYIMPTERHIYGEPEMNLLPNPGILPEMAINYNLGARYGLVDFGKHKLALYGNFFWRNGYDKIILQTRVDPVLEGRENQVEDIQVTQFVNLAKTQSMGFEGEVNYIYDNKLNAMLNFSKFNSLFKVEQDERGKPHSLYGLQVPNEPFFTVNGNVQYRLRNLFQRHSAMNLYYNMGYVAPFSTIWVESEWFTTPTQFAHDLGVSYRFPSGKLVASLDAKNIFNAEVYDNFGVQKPGRAFYVKLNYTINNFK
ncbi:TonB-dependent receptor [Sphingobacterium arenae]|uniref:TonB-dependent receptor plug domain-containing protein n=1 Tax=Sphingobacterium arenae TaxID=1280598 RepID=A0ABR7XZA8_9SPHI|nr:TonB-dependent receptor plug domain-containing protein [Sphingobacterium arenae]MBD1424389.1 TonB-dependent receptor plug domain-containing protein [Sphingobacterium arenae]